MNGSSMAENGLRLGQQEQRIQPLCVRQNWMCQVTVLLA